MLVCFDSNCLAILFDSAATNPANRYGTPIDHARERLLEFIRLKNPTILVPTVQYFELFMISSIDKNQLDSQLYSNKTYVLQPFDFRAASMMADIEKETRGKRLTRDDTMAKIKFDRQILSIAKVHGVEVAFSTDNGFFIDAERYNVNAQCPGMLPLPDSIKQPGLFEPADYS